MSFRSGLLAAVATVGILAIAPTSAVATESTESVDNIAAIIDRAAPGDHSVAVPNRIADDVVTFANAATEVSVPTNPSDAVALVAPQGNVLEISLPSELRVNDGRVADDGTVVFTDEGGSAHAAVQALADGSLRMQTILENGGAPSSYTYDLGEGTTPILRDDGTVELTREMAGGVTTTVGTIDAPWAVDAAGDDVTTWYTVVGSKVIQHVEHGSGDAYPITADPRVSFGWAIYVKYSKSDVNRTTAGLGGAINDKAGFALILCGKIPHWAAKMGCGMVAGRYHTSIYNTFKSAKSQKKCVEIQLAYGSYLPVVWKTYSC